MANKKFYYHGKKSGSRGGQSKSVNSSSEAPRYSADKLALTLEQLGISESSRELLSKNKIATAADLARRTEKEIFKVQGLNKRVFFELKDALKAAGMEFRPEAAPRPHTEKTAGPRDERRTAGERGNAPVREKADARRRDEKREVKPTPRPEKPKKITEPLPVEEWRKIQKGGLWGFHDGMKTVIEPAFDEVFSFKEGLASVESDEKCGYIDPAGEIVIPLEYETAMSFSGGYASVVKGGKCGYIDPTNEVIIPFIYDAATPFENGEAKVKKDGRWGTILPDGSVKWI